MNIQTMLRAGRPVPAEFRSNFLHLYLDIAWYGVLAASAVSFLAVYATRQGASGFQLGLLSAGPAAVSLVFTLPAGRWLGGRELGRAVFWAAALHRLFYLVWIPLPLLLAPGQQVWALLATVFVMSLPGTALAVGFNALFADAVPVEWRGYVAGRRNALLAILFIAVSLICGRLLDTLPFPTSYQVVFGIGAVGAAMSTLHLWYVRPRPNGRARPAQPRSTGDLARPGTLKTLADSVRPEVGLRFLTREPRPRRTVRTDVLRGSYARLMVGMATFHLGLYMAAPLLPLRWVNAMRLSDQQIGLGTAVFYVAVFAGSMPLASLVHRLGNRRVMALGALVMASYPVFMAVGTSLELYLVGSAGGGLGWSLVGGAMANYVLEKMPEDDRPAHLAWFNLTANAALLVGALTGPWLGELMGVAAALGLAGALRVVAALAILRCD